MLLNKDAANFAVPSKIYSYLLMKKYILASMPKDNLGSKNITYFSSGYVSEPNNNKILYQNFNKIINNIKSKKKILNKYNLVREKNLNKMLNIINKMN